MQRYGPNGDSGTSVINLLIVQRGKFISERYPVLSHPKPSLLGLTREIPEEQPDSNLGRSNPRSDTPEASCKRIYAYWEAGFHLPRLNNGDSVYSDTHTTNRFLSDVVANERKI